MRRRPVRFRASGQVDHRFHGHLTVAQPQQALDLFDQGTQLTTHDPAGHTDDTAGDLGTGQAQQSGRSPFGRPGVDPRPPATLYIHLSEDWFCL